MRFRTKKGQAIEPYTGACPQFSVEREEHGKRQKLCQILPPVPQRFEWINAENIVTIKDGK